MKKSILEELAGIARYVNNSSKSGSISYFNKFPNWPGNEIYIQFR